MCSMSEVPGPERGIPLGYIIIMFRLSDLEYSAGSGVTRVNSVLFLLMMLCVAQFVIGSRYGCKIVSAAL